MADQKVTERVSLTTGVDPVNDILPIVDVSAGASGSKKITINDLFAGWGMTPVGASLVKATSLSEQKVMLGVGAMQFHPELTQLTGGTANALDGLPTVGFPTGIRKLLVYNGFLMFYKLTGNGNPADEVPMRVVPDDFNASTNARAWFQDHVYFGNLKTSGFSMYDGAHSVVIMPAITADRVVVFPDMDGTIAIDSAHMHLSGVVSTTTVVPRMQDSFIYLDDPGPFVSHTLSLPLDADAREGQRVFFKSRAPITTFVIEPNGADLDPTAPTTITAEQSFELVYFKQAGIWIRTK